ncbi:MAG TPA: peptide deformylase [Steroidobacteraceae bacterium]|nr:peptide deformylase [Steroidobacteraceae bacterium]
MTKLVILEYPDPRLRTKAAPVEVFDEQIRRLVGDMLETMYGANGVGLAGTQVDIHRRLLVVDISEPRNQPIVLINPEILASDGHCLLEEGCLSLPGIYAKVNRAQKIRIGAQDRDGHAFEMDAEGLAAVCIQHEMDHLEGRLFVDYLSELKRQLVRRRLAKERRQRSVNNGTAAPAPAL